MSRRSERPTLLLALAAACLVVGLLGQAGADALVADASGVATNRAIGRAASSYLSGLKTFAAAALWNRMEPVFHNYYGGVALEDQRYMLTTIAAVQALDPHAVQSFYIGSWVLAQNDRLEEGIAMAERGVEANPRAGILRVGLAQMRMLMKDDLDGAVEMAERALADDTLWTDPIEQANAYLAMRAIFESAGRHDLAASADELLLRVEADHGDELDFENHDHDGDGEQDH